MCEKNEKIKAALMATREKRQNQDCKVRTLKIQANKLNATTREHLYMLFTEAKWLTNAVIASEDIFHFDYRVTEVTSKDKDKNDVVKQISHLSAQMKQAIVDNVRQQIINLSKAKKVMKVGKLKFKSQINAIPLKQASVTYKMVGSKLKIQGIKQLLRVNGVEQIKGELANAVLTKNEHGFFIKVTTYEEKGRAAQTNGKSIGLDFGIKTQITTCDSDNNVEKLNWDFTEPHKLKRAQQRVSQLQQPRGHKQSHNYYSAKRQLNKQQENLSNHKKEAINKTVHSLKLYDNVCLQNEQIANWKSSKMKGWGKRIHHSIMGGIISKLKDLPTAIVLDKFVPTTSKCPKCLARLKLTLADREIHCACGYSSDRDTHSAKMMMLYGLGLIV